MSAFAARAGQAVVSAGATAAEVKAATPTPKRVKVRSSSANYRPVATTLTVVFGLGFLKRWLVDKQPMPERTWWVNMAILGFTLSMMAEIAPRMGKNMSYLVLTAVIFAQAIPILDALDKQTKPPVLPNERLGQIDPTITPVTPIGRGR